MKTMATKHCSQKAQMAVNIITVYINKYLSKWCWLSVKELVAKIPILKKRRQTTIHKRDLFDRRFVNTTP